MLNRKVSKENEERCLLLPFLFVEDAESSQELVELRFEGGLVFAAMRARIGVENRLMST